MLCALLKASPVVVKPEKPRKKAPASSLLSSQSLSNTRNAGQPLVPTLSMVNIPSSSTTSQPPPTLQSATPLVPSTPHATPASSLLPIAPASNPEGVVDPSTISSDPSTTVLVNGSTAHSSIPSAAPAVVSADVPASTDSTSVPLANAAVVSDATFVITPAPSVAIQSTTAPNASVVDLSANAAADVGAAPHNTVPPTADSSNTIASNVVVSSPVDEGGNGSTNMPAMVVAGSELRKVAGEVDDSDSLRKSSAGMRM